MLGLYIVWPCWVESLEILGTEGRTRKPAAGAATRLPTSVHPPPGRTRPHWDSSTEVVHGIN